MDIDILRKKLSIPYVMDQYGQAPVSVEAGRLRYHNPFREDNNPSFDVWYDEERGWRAGDYAEGWTGSAIDVVDRFQDAEGEPLFAHASAMYISQLESDWTDPVVQREKKKFNAEEAHVRVSSAQAGGKGETALRGVVAQMAHEGTHPGLVAADPTRVAHAWRLGGEGGDILAPYYDLDGELSGYKVRSGDRKFNAPGARLGLYGIWKLTDDDRPILLVEGESDAWAAQDALPEMCVLGVPGAGAQPEQVGASALADRTVYLCFDGDEAGQRAARTWSEDLGGRGATVLYIPMPDGFDVCGLTVDRIRALPSEARAPLPAPEDFIRAGHVYAKPRSQGAAKPVSNWVLDLRKEVVGDQGDIGYEGILQPVNRVVVLPAAATSTANQLATWCRKNGVAWTGGSQDNARLLQLMQSEALTVPRGRMTRRVGLHGTSFVWHDGHIGDEDWTWVPPVAEVDVASMLHITPAPVHVQGTFTSLMHMYHARVMTPLLAWLATAPLRPLFPQYPNVFVSGASGAGKTTLLELAVSTFSGSSLRTGLGSASPYGIEAMFSASNGFPLLIDEYRNGSKKEAMERVDTLLRLAYTGMFDQKGGQQEDKSKVSKILSDCPVIVSGEDSLIETSTTDRSILIRLRKQDRGTLTHIQRAQSAGFAHRYLTWLQQQLPMDVHVTPFEQDGLNDRQQYNIGVLQFGWRLLREFIESTLTDAERINWVFPALDLSLVLEETREAASQNPTTDAVKWAVDEQLDCVWLDPELGVLYVQPQQLLVEINRSGAAFKLPGSNATTIKKILLDEHDGKQVRVRKPHGGPNAVHCVAIPADVLD